MSPRAAWRLESLGFPTVFDYVAGKADWFANGLPRAGTDASIPRAGETAQRDVPTCLLAEQVGEVRERVQQADWDSCLVVNGENVVLGRVRGKAFAAAVETPIEQVMEAGPTTIRPDTRVEDITTRMRARKVESIIVTTSDGRLVGILDRDAAEQRLSNTST